MKKRGNEIGIFRKLPEIAGKSRFMILFEIVLIAFAFHFFSCNEDSTIQIITEGEIKYRIEYLDDEKVNSLIPLLPSEMTTSFKCSASRTMIEGLFGTFKLIYILNQPKNTNYTLLQILDKKYVYQSSINEMAFGYQDMKKVRIIYSDKVKNIAGYRCKHATAVFQNGTNDTAEIYYTNDIGLINANRNNPFKEIEGVLMEFSVNLVEINMKFTAKKVIGKKIDDRLFDLPAGFVNISENHMRKLITDYNQTTTQ
jgi:hypothetical protein